MSGSHQQNFSGDACSHSETIEDDHTCELVCTCCGLVLEKIYTQTYFANNFVPDIKLLKTQNHIFDVCENSCISKNIADLTFSRFRELIVLPQFRKTNPNHLAAYALYEILNKEKCPRTSQEISYYTDVPLKTFFKIESSIGQNCILNNPEYYIERFSSLLNLSYKDEKKINEIVGEISKYVGTVKATCLVATAICIHVKNIKVNITIKEICKTCHVATASIHRSLRTLREKKFTL